MLRALMLFIALLALAAISAMAAQPFYTLEYACQEKYCITGQAINWTITFANSGQSDMKIVGVEMVDTVNESVIAQFMYDYDPANSEKREFLKVSPSHSGTIVVIGTLSTPHANEQLIYQPCITTALDSTSAQYVGNYTERKCYTNETLRIVQCTRDEHCADALQCTAGVCIPVKCPGECTYIANHSCQSYECCSSESCEPEESCTGNRCVPLSCLEHERIENHSCVPVVCDEHEYLENKSCIPLDCGEEEGYVNHSCVTLNCSDYQHIINHSCSMLYCREDEYPENHSCHRLSCGPDEIIAGHQCVTLTCGFFEERLGNECVMDSKMVFGLFVELVLLGTAIALLVVDVKSLRSRMRKTREA